MLYNLHISPNVRPHLTDAVLCPSGNSIIDEDGRRTPSINISDKWWLLCVSPVPKESYLAQLLLSHSRGIFFLP